jgi:hypothetical protein
MAASSVTGLSGPGMSHGLYKPENHRGCNCGGKPSTPVETVVVKTLCAVRVVTGGTVGVNAGQRPVGTRVCI